MSSYRPFIMWAALAATVAGQAPPAPPVPIQGVRNNPVAPVLPANNAKPNQQAGDPADSLGDTKIVESITEPKLSGDNLAGLYRRYTGRRVITTSAASAAEFSFVQEATPEDPLTFREAAELLRKAAVLEGFVFTEHPEDPGLDILTLATGGPRPTNVKVDVYSDNSKLPDEDVVITYVMTLNYIKSEQAVQIFTQIIGQLGAYGSISAVPNASAVVITEKASLIKSLIDLKETIDVPGSVQDTRFIQVQYADVTELSTMLNEMLTAQQSAQTTAGVQRTQAAGGNAPPVPGGAAPAGGGTGGGGETTPVQIMPDTRTNRIFAMGRPVDILFVENLVRQFDIPTSERTFLRRKLRFLTVSDFMPVAGDALMRAFSGTGGEGGATTGAGSQSRARPASGSSSSRSSSASSGFGNDNRNNRSGGMNDGFGGGGGGSGASLGDPNVNIAPESMLVGRTLLVADNLTNSIVVQGPPSALEIVNRLLDQLDMKPQQVMISTVIGQLSLNKTLDVGFSYLMDGTDAQGGGGGGPFNVRPLVSGQLPRFEPSSLAAAGMRVYGQVGDLSGYLNALSSRSDFKVLSRPSIFTSNNKKGVISSGERIAIPTEGGGSYGGTYQSGARIQYEDVLLKLEVIPLVNSDDEITMEIILLSDEQNGTQTIQGAGGEGGALEVPRITTREIQTNVTVPNDQTIVLGGLITGRKDKQRSGIPLLSDIPVVGGLFSSTNNTQDRSELMIFIRPTIISDDESLQEVQTDMDQRYGINENMRGFEAGTSDVFGNPVSEAGTGEQEKAARRLGPAHRRH